MGMKVVRQWPLGPTGFWYERTGRNDIVLHWNGVGASTSRAVAAQMVRAVREGIRKATQ